MDQALAILSRASVEELSRFLADASQCNQLLSLSKVLAVVCCSIKLDEYQVANKAIHLLSPQSQPTNDQLLTSPQIGQVSPSPDIARAQYSSGDALRVNSNKAYPSSQSVQNTGLETISLENPNDSSSGIIGSDQDGTKKGNGVEQNISEKPKKPPATRDQMIKWWWDNRSTFDHDKLADLRKEIRQKISGDIRLAYLRPEKKGRMNHQCLLAMSRISFALEYHQYQSQAGGRASDLLEFLESTDPQSNGQKAKKNGQITAFARKKEYAEDDITNVRKAVQKGNMLWYLLRRSYELGLKELAIVVACWKAMSSFTKACWETLFLQLNAMRKDSEQAKIGDQDLAFTTFISREEHSLIETFIEFEDMRRKPTSKTPDPRQNKVGIYYEIELLLGLKKNILSLWWENRSTRLEREIAERENSFEKQQKAGKRGSVDQYKRIAKRRQIASSLDSQTGASRHLDTGPSSISPLHIEHQRVASRQDNLCAEPSSEWNETGLEEPSCEYNVEAFSNQQEGIDEILHRDISSVNNDLVIDTIFPDVAGLWRRDGFEDFGSMWSDRALQVTNGY